MNEKPKPFEQLNDEDRMAAIDVAIAAVLIGLRIPSTGKPLYDWIATEFSSCRSLPPNVVKYALRSLGQELYGQDWTMTIEKRGGGLVTKFVPQGAGGNGEEETNVIIR
jgi:hypothetical protein